MITHDTNQVKACDRNRKLCLFKPGNQYQHSTRVLVVLAGCLLLGAPRAWSQTHPKTAIKKGASTAHRSTAASAVPTAALNEMSRRLLYQCADGGNDFIRAFVYQAYMRAGSRYRYEVDEQLGKLATSKKSRDTILEAINTRCNGERSALMDNLYSGLGLSMTSAKTLTQYIIQHYHLPQDEPVAEPEVESGDGTK